MTISSHVYSQLCDKSSAATTTQQRLIRLEPADSKAGAIVQLSNQKEIQMWTQEEHERFLEALEKYPSGPWKLIAEHVGTRTPRQAMTHAQKYRQKIQRRQRGLKTRAKRSASENMSPNAGGVSPTSQQQLPQQQLVLKPMPLDNPVDHYGHAEEWSTNVMPTNVAIQSPHGSCDGRCQMAGEQAITVTHWQGERRSMSMPITPSTVAESHPTPHPQIYHRSISVPSRPQAVGGVDELRGAFNLGVLSQIAVTSASPCQHHSSPSNHTTPNSHALDSPRLPSFASLLPIKEPPRGRCCCCCHCHHSSSGNSSGHEHAYAQDHGHGHVHSHEPPQASSHAHAHLPPQSRASHVS